MYNEKTEEKRYTHSDYEQHDCPVCHGLGLDPLAVFSHTVCPQCNGDGRAMRENKREQDSAFHRQMGNNNEAKNKWLFG